METPKDQIKKELGSTVSTIMSKTAERERIKMALEKIELEIKIAQETAEELLKKL